MTKREQILKFLDQRIVKSGNAQNVITQLGMNPHTARGRLSELERDGFVETTVQGRPGVAYSTYKLTTKGVVAASRIAGSPFPAQPTTPTPA